MTRRFTVTFILLYLLAWSAPCWASHIVGGNVRLVATGKTNRYVLGIHLFMDDLNSNVGDVKSEVVVTIYGRRNNIKMGDYKLPLTDKKVISTTNNACVNLRPLKLSEVRYAAELTLDPDRFDDARGYYVVYGTCCRNPTINNIVQPNDAGMVFHLEFPSLKERVNSSPVFSNPVTLYACINKPLTFSFKATDADNDVLRYSLVTPYKGFTSQSNGASNEPSQNYPTVQWQNGFDAGNAVPGSPTLQIDMNTGLLSVTPNQIGLFVFTVLCEELRVEPGNALQRIGSVRRDFQIAVVECPPITPPEPVISLKTSPPSAVTATKNGFLTGVAVCEGQTVTLRTDSLPEWGYQWQRDGVALEGDTLASLVAQQPGTYTIVKRFTNTCGQTSTSPVSVKLDYGTAEAVKIAADGPTDFCPGNGVNLLASNGNYTYRWYKNKTPINGEATSAIRVTEAGNYKVQTTSKATGCVSSDSLAVLVHTNPVVKLENAILARGSALTLNPFGSDTLQYQWSPPASLDNPGMARPKASPATTTTYQVAVTSPQGCTTTAQMTVTVFVRLLVPDAFSPNGDGVNDTWDIRGIEEYPDCTVDIYNRWGSLVYHSKGYAQAWDGKYNGENLPTGMYQYVIRSRDLPEDRRGAVLVVR
ncbi:gliding motility-associated C-terminal domain-containing protein [Tellurirhabdus bombi]|uniref:gliding motility-associated C-terminal domain-containing protein n=1 Tax=Tellurirhabdus bombi TaxID=2907205 RepID=UPI001F186527|nr:gliding motility-associated C-terminal domain-containing protein [Tellurirhabdus bombi]